MNNQEDRTNILPTDQNQPISLIVNRPEADETSINLGNVFHNMKLKSRVYAWVLVLCLVVGICAPLLLYQISKPELTVSSIVTLRYEVQPKGSRSAWPVTDLTAPDGSQLDVNQVTSSYVLQTALDSLSLSKHVTAAALRNNIGIKTLLTEESSRTKESLQGLAENKNADAYKQMVDAEMKYQNRFVVSLTNGFKEDEDSKVVQDLTDTELKLLLDRVLTVYNEYLIRTYADVKLPEDTFSMIDIQELDISDSVDELRKGINALYSYCSEKSATVKAYRSRETGRSLEDWMKTIQTFKSINIDYLYALVSDNAVTRDKTSLLTNWKYQLRMAQNNLDEINENITETRKILKNYKNDEVYLSMQESDAAKMTKASTDYYNSLVLQLTGYYDQVAELKATIAEYTDRINKLDAMKETAVSEDIEAELSRSLTSAQSLYNGIRAHMEELFVSPMYTTYEDHSAAQGKLPGFLAANVKKIIIGAVAGAVIACGVWFLAGLAPEFSKGRKAEAKGKEAADK